MPAASSPVGRFNFFVVSLTCIFSASRTITLPPSFPVGSARVSVNHSLAPCMCARVCVWSASFPSRLMRLSCFSPSIFGSTRTHNTAALNRRGLMFSLSSPCPSLTRNTDALMRGQRQVELGWEKASDPRRRGPCDSASAVVSRTFPLRIQRAFHCLSCIRVCLRVCNDWYAG